MSHHADQNDQTGQAQQAFTVEAGTDGYPTIVHVSGALDYDTSPVLGAVIDRLWEELDGDHLLLNLERTTFCDSVGLSRLIAAFTGSQQRGVTLLLVAPQPFMRHVLDLTGLSRILMIRDSLAQALDEARERSTNDQGHVPSL
ncbi:STAS domain-containing protein [Streptosporangium sp. NPDC049376]|uniref:STAS domain-containing protein n=1 Tax=Streptosporangium sp. NPDC049376 TaxID=3366192 RepID=UPI0037A082FA